MKNLTRYNLVRDDQDGVCFCQVKESDCGEWVKFSDVMELLQTEGATGGGHSTTNNARDEICAAWLPNEAACAFWGACNCAEVPCRNTRKLSPVAPNVICH